MVFSPEQFYNNSGLRASLKTPENKIHKPKYSKSEEFRRSISEKYSRIDRNDLNAHKRHRRLNQIFDNCDLKSKVGSNKGDIRTYCKNFKNKNLVLDKFTNELKQNGKINNLNKQNAKPLQTINLNNNENSNGIKLDEQAVLQRNGKKESTEQNKQCSTNPASETIGFELNTLLFSNTSELNPFCTSTNNIYNNFTSLFGIESSDLKKDKNPDYINIIEFNPSVDVTTPHGLNNLGNTCYLNSVVQTLFSFNFFIDELKNIFNLLKEHLNNEIENCLPITYNLLKLYKEYCVGSKSIIDCLTSFKACFGDRVKHFKSSEQQDAAEFFTFILDILKQEIDGRISSMSSLLIRNPVERYFEYELSSEAMCHICGKFSNQSIPNDKSNTFHLQLIDDFSIQSAFLKYLKDESSPLKCLDCDDNFVINKQFVELPKILFFQMLRYSENGSKENKKVPLSHVVYLPKKYIKQQNYLLSPLSTPFKLSLNKSYDLISKEKSSIVKKIKFNENESGLNSNGEISLDQQSSLYTDENNGSVNSKNLINFMEINPSPQIKSSDSIFDESECEKYQLVSVICHQGPSINCGHYTSYVYSFDKHKWFFCDDIDVIEVPFTEVENFSSTTGYCYFYAHTVAS